MQNGTKYKIPLDPLLRESNGKSRFKFPPSPHPRQTRSPVDLIEFDGTTEINNPN